MSGSANSSGRLQGKVAIITGVASGMGRQAAITFAREGAHVIGCDTLRIRDDRLTYPGI